jgi:RNA polymerase sigma-70 factor, ECF subfamily
VQEDAMSDQDDSEQRALLAAAQAGDERAFEQLVQPYRTALQVHCYRMLGSRHDAEDAVQETFLRAWRALGRYEPRAALKTWLYRIATNVCLDEIERRPRRAEPVAPYTEPAADQHASPTYDPAARYALREGLELSLLAAIQELPGRQRAVLILRDVLGWSSPEVAELLESTTAAVNSALQRARSTVELILPEEPSEAAGGTERELLRRYVEAFANDDVDALIALLREDAILRMPPQRMLRGAPEIAEFLRSAAGGRLSAMKLTPIQANGRPAVAAHKLTQAGTLVPHGVLVLEVRGDRIVRIDAFIDPALLSSPGLAAV